MLCCRSSLYQELKDTAERLVCGNLAVLPDGLEKYQQTVDEASTISDLVSQIPTTKSHFVLVS